MRQFAWYSPEIDVIVFQTFMAGCFIAYEWDYNDMCKHLKYPDIGIDHYFWIPLGEL